MQIGLKLGSLAGVNRIRVSRQSCRRLTGFFPGFALLQLHFEWVECLRCTHPGGLPSYPGTSWDNPLDLGHYLCTTNNELASGVFHVCKHKHFAQHWQTHFA